MFSYGEQSKQNKIIIPRYRCNHPSCGKMFLRREIRSERKRLYLTEEGVVIKTEAMGDVPFLACPYRETHKVKRLHSRLNEYEHRNRSLLLSGIAPYGHAVIDASPV